jgi:hypothetical protein
MSKESGQMSFHLPASGNPSQHGIDHRSRTRAFRPDGQPAHSIQSSFRHAPPQFRLSGTSGDSIDRLRGECARAHEACVDCIKTQLPGLPNPKTFCRMLR